jgi:uncharacterized protein (DUF736 family)
MSQSIKNFSIFKKDKKQDNHPDYSISAKVQKDNVDEYREIGAGYIKEGQKGKFISVALSKPREYMGKQYSGYVIVDEERYLKMEKVYEDYLIQQRNPGYPTPTSQGIDLSKTLTTPEINPEDLDNWEQDFM